MKTKSDMRGLNTSGGADIDFMMNIKLWIEFELDSQNFSIRAARVDPCPSRTRESDPRYAFSKFLASGKEEQENEEDERTKANKSVGFVWFNSWRRVTCWLMCASAATVTFEASTTTTTTLGRGERADREAGPRSVRPQLAAATCE